MTTKISVSLTQDDIAALDEHVRTAGLKGRSAGVQEAIRRLREADLERDYEIAFTTEDISDEWDVTVGDGIS